MKISYSSLCKVSINAADQNVGMGKQNETIKLFSKHCFIWGLLSVVVLDNQWFNANALLSSDLLYIEFLSCDLLYSELIFSDLLYSGTVHVIVGTDVLY